ncbi:MAG: cytochrome d ubiquinol oxidase subunit II [Gemmatimonadetes bacterium]|nr:cytochrome d ubiquinol oxidase subunit II [Gemmatimonadota bacterium]
MLGLKRASLPGLEPTRVPCVQCDRREYGLSWGDFCSICREERRIRADRVAKRVGIVAAALMAAWHLWRTPPNLTQRVFAAASVLLVYFVARRLVSRLLIEYLPKELRNRSVESRQDQNAEDPK